MKQPLTRKLIAEYVGSLLLAALVIGSGIAAQRLSPGDTGLQLTENAAATATGLFAIILVFGPISGAHFNPVVSIVDAGLGGLPWRHAIAYLPAQLSGCVSGAILANLMFSTRAISISTTHRGTLAHGLSEVVATGGLILMIFSLARSGRTAQAPAAVGAYLGAAYFFTSSTSFANPAITVGQQHLRRHRPVRGTDLHHRAVPRRRALDPARPYPLPRHPDQPRARCRRLARGCAVRSLKPIDFAEFTRRSVAHAAPFDEDGVVPDAVALGDAFADADGAEPGRVVQAAAGAVFGEDRRLQGPQSRLVGGAGTPGR
jgi:glycerol uptake facilitator-like aquaporin